MDSGIKRRALPWIGLTAILLMYAVSVFRFNPSDYFGATQDDSLYFSSAKALANRQGYILPSVPGGPIATKYPMLYPWILSWVWRCNPSFPSNLRYAVAINVLFGFMFLVSSFVFLRRQKGFGDSAAILVTFFIGLHPFVLYYSASVLSDIPFAALAFTAILVADQAMEPNATDAKTARCAFLTGLSILMRFFGVTVAAGILATAVARRAWRQVAIFCGTLVPFGVAVIWRWVFAGPVTPLGSSTAVREPGFIDAWIYYSSYQGFWKLCVLDAHLLCATVRHSAIIILRSPSEYFLAPLLTRNSILGVSLMLLTALGTLAGMVRQSRNDRYKSIYWVFPFYVALVLVWNYPNTGRFFLLLLPLFAGALWVEARHFLTVSYTTMKNSPDRSQKILAGICGFGIVAFACGIGINYAYGGRRVLVELSRERSSLLGEKREAYRWLSCCTSPDDVVIAYEDASLYLYSGRQAMRPVVFRTSGEYDPVQLQVSLAHMTDVAHAIGARYWLIADDDFSMEWEPATSLGRAREVELAKDLPLAFQSHNGRIRIYRIGCDQGSKIQPCP